VNIKNPRSLVGLMLVLLIILTAVFYFAKNRPSADVSTGGVERETAATTLEEAIKERPFAISACAPEDKDNPNANSCESFINVAYRGPDGSEGALDPYPTDLPTLRPVFDLRDFLVTGLSDCIWAIHNLVAAENNLEDYREQTNLNCTVDSSDDDFYVVTGEFKPAGSDVENFIQDARFDSFQQSTVGNLGLVITKARIPKSSFSFGTYMGIEIPDNDLSKNPDKIEILETAGEFTPDLTFKLDITNDNTHNLKNFAGLEFSNYSGTWLTSIKGLAQIRYVIAWNWKKDSDQENPVPTLSSIDFCPNSCEITVEDKISSFSGDFISRELIAGSINNFDYIRRDVHTGSGFGDVATGKVYWNEDKKTISSEFREYQLKFENGIQYGENFGDNATDEPFKKHNTTSYSYTRGLTAVGPGFITICVAGETCPGDSDGPPLPDPNAGPPPEFLPILDHAIVGYYHIESDTTNGAGSGSAGGTLTQSDVETPLSPISHAGQGQIQSAFYSALHNALKNGSRDPDVNRKIYNHLNVISNINKSIVYDIDPSPKIMVSPQYQIMPKHIAFMLYDSKDGVAEAIASQMDRLQKEAESMGVTTIFLRTDNDYRILTALADSTFLPNGSWLMLGGHGSANGPSWADNRVVGNISLPEMRKALGDKQIDLLIANSCNSARWSSLASTVVGSVGWGLISNNTSELSAVATLGGNSYTLTDRDIDNYVAGLLKQNVSCNMLDRPAPEKEDPGISNNDDSIGDSLEPDPLSSTRDLSSGSNLSTNSPQVTKSDPENGLPDWLGGYIWHDRCGVWKAGTCYDVATGEVTATDLSIINELPEYAPEPDYEFVESFANDMFNWEPEPTIYHDPYPYTEDFAVVDYYYVPESEPLFDDWYDYLTPMDYLDYTYDVFEYFVTSVTDWVMDFF